MDRAWAEEICKRCITSGIVKLMNKILVCAFPHAQVYIL